MTIYIHDWLSIAPQFRGGSLILGNGASIAVDRRFSYPSLIEYARDNQLLTEDVHQLFSFFDTADFELVLRLVWQASNVNRSLHIFDERTHQAYLRVRDCLIESVRNIHPEYQEILPHLPSIYDFLKDFRTVISLSYDLIVYWTIMYGQSIVDHHSLKDCFINGDFCNNWKILRQPIYRARSTTLVFYPHGSLVLCRDKVESEFKIYGNGLNLLHAILRKWETELVVPLFVSEGSSQQKINSIQSSNYLNIVYREVLTNLEDSLVIYGWGLGEQDSYILKQIALAGIRKVAISVYGNDQAYCNRVSELIYRTLGQRTEVIFFHSNSPGCWNNTEDNI